MKTALVDGVPAVSTTELCRRIGLTVSSTVLKGLRAAKPLAETATGIYWRESDIQPLAEALADHVSGRPYKKRSTWSSALRCGWYAWRVVDDGHLALEMPTNHCCDMRGAIKTAEAMCPLVWRIDTYAGGVPDMVYFMVTGSTEWTAREMIKRDTKAAKTASA